MERFLVESHQKPFSFKMFPWVRHWRFVFLFLCSPSPTGKHVSSYGCLPFLQCRLSSSLTSLPVLPGISHCIIFSTKYFPFHTLDPEFPVEGFSFYIYGVLLQKKTISHLLDTWLFFNVGLSRHLFLFNVEVPPFLLIHLSPLSLKSLFLSGQCLLVHFQSVLHLVYTCLFTH